MKTFKQQLCLCFNYFDPRALYGHFIKKIQEMFLQEIYAPYSDAFTSVEVFEASKLIQTLYEKFLNFGHVQCNNLAVKLS